MTDNSRTSSKASLVWITPEAEGTIVHCARVSNPSGQESGRSPDRLIRYLVKHKHWSPFEMASLCVEINTTRDIAAQILRHRSFSFQEFSQRYSRSDVLGTAEVPVLRMQDPTNKQSSLLPLPHQQMSILEFDSEITRLFSLSYDLYDRMLDYGVAKESARKILPLNAPTRLYMAGTIRSWIHYLQIRTGEETQLEHRVVAQAVAEIFREHLPTIYQELLCQAESTSPSNKPERSLPVSLKEPTTGSKLKEFFKPLVNRLLRFRG